MQVQVTFRRPAKKIRPTWVMLWAQDQSCFWCGLWVHPADASVDHLYAQKWTRWGMGGGIFGDTLANCVLAHKECNAHRGAPNPTPELVKLIYTRAGWTSMPFWMVAPAILSMVGGFDEPPLIT